MADTISTLAAKLRPHWLRDVANVTAATVTGAAGVTDHGALTGLGDNDHSQYVLKTTTLEAGAGMTGGGGLSASTLTFDVGVSGLGLSVSADAVTLTSSSDVGTVPAAAILASTAAGALTVASLFANNHVSTSRIDTASSNLTLAPATNIVSLPSAVAVQTDNYASQLTGWRATYTGEADFRYLFVDEMHAKSFIADLEQALAGAQIICKSVAMVASAFTMPAASGTATLRVRDLPSAANMAAFQSGDIVRLRTFSRSGGSLTIADAWGVVTSYADGTGADEGTQTWTFTRSAAPNAGGMSASTVIQPDALVLDYGTTGNGYYEVNAIDGAYGLNSPYARIATWTTHPATGTALRAQFGNLRGVYGYSGTEFGVAMGSSTGANVTVDATNGVRLRQGTTDTIVLAPNGASYFAGVMTIDTNGEIRQGTGTLGSNYTGLRIWRDSGIGRIGGYNSNSLQWYANTDGKLYAGGGNVMLDATGLTLDIGDYQADKLFPYVDIAWKAGSAESGRIGSGELNNVDVYGMRFWAGGAGLTQSGNGKFEFISRDGSGTATGTATIVDGAFLGEGQVSGSSLYTTGDLTIGGETNVRQHTTTEQWSVDIANGTSLTMANAAVFQFSDAAVFSGLIIVTNTTNGGVGLFTAGGAVVTKVADGSNTYATAKDTASKTNVYYDAGSGEYQMQNNTGGSRTYSIFTIRTRASS